jgi:hypothetical protein
MSGRPNRMPSWHDRDPDGHRLDPPPRRPVDPRRRDRRRPGINVVNAILTRGERDEPREVIGRTTA